MNFQDELTRKTTEADQILRNYLPDSEGFPRTLAEAMSYSLTAGGKRLRMLLLAESYRAAGGREKVYEPFMAGIEMIHTHSLIHDDLPALDNDDYRRGRLTTHKVYGEALGILAGDALLNYAYEVMLEGFSLTAYPDRAAAALSVIARKTGIRGMLGGQSFDVENDGKPLDAASLDYIYRNKTSALIEAPLMAGAVLAGADSRTEQLLEQAGTYIGLAFQIRDDILDVTSDSKTLGKPVHSDEKNHKVTYVTLYGTGKAAEKVHDLTGRAVEYLRSAFGQESFLEELVQSMAVRNK